MHDELAVRERNRRQHLLEQRGHIPHALQRIGRAFKVRDDALTFNQFKHQKALEICRQSGIEQVRNIRMRQTSQQFTFMRKAGARMGRQRQRAQQLYREL